MIVAVCLDDDNGMLFNKRRQSRDRAQQEDLLEVCGSQRLWMAPYSAPLFGWAADRIITDEEFLEKAGEEDVCFVEDRPLAPVSDRIKELIVYRWQRKYPADLRFDLDLSDSGDPESYWLWEMKTFPGSSHETIIREWYVRRKDAWQREEREED